MSTYIDTHVAVWLYAGEIKKIAHDARDAIDKADGLLISPMALLELAYLNEIQRISATSADIALALRAEWGCEVCNLPFLEVVVAACRETWTRDPFDRIIVAQARANNQSQLVTADTRIREVYAEAIWDKSGVYGSPTTE